MHTPQHEYSIIMEILDTSDSQNRGRGRRAGKRVLMKKNGLVVFLKHKRLVYDYKKQQKNRFSRIYISCQLKPTTLVRSYAGIRLSPVDTELVVEIGLELLILYCFRYVYLCRFVHCFAINGNTTKVPSDLSNTTLHILEDSWSGHQCTNWKLSK